MSTETLDSVTLEILWTRLVSAVDEAAAAFVRTSFSTLVREANDFAVVLTDAKGRSLAQSSMSIPSFIGTLPATVKHFIAHFTPAGLQPGDVLVTNDPWNGTGHVHDVSVAMPIFRNGELIAFAAATSHMPDIGGRLRNSGNREIFEEGLQIPTVKLVRAGVTDETVVAFIRQNVRVPEQTLGDIWGEVSACRMLESRLTDLLDESDIDFDALGHEIRARSEHAMRDAIRALPDGDYACRLEHDGFEEPVVVQSLVRIMGDRIHIDYTGSSPQLSRSVNVVPIYTFAYTAFGVKALLSPDIPNNEGSFLPLTTSAPEGSIFNPRRPSATGARSLVGHLLPVAFIAALADVLPDKVVAPGTANSSFTMSGQENGRPYAVVNFLNAGQGASSSRDGLSATSFPSNLGNTPIEVMESGAPITILYRKIRRGSGGRGRHHGGDGLDLAFEFKGETPAMCSFLLTRFRAAAPGLLGGEAGAPAEVLLNGKPIDPAEHWVLNKGDHVVMRTAGGGGLGHSQNAS
ncbi:MAG: hydantoinase B/oxoprolinase family protein [Variibacter sp.]